MLHGAYGSAYGGRCYRVVGEGAGGTRQTCHQKGGQEPSVVWTRRPRGLGRACSGSRRVEPVWLGEILFRSPRVALTGDCPHLGQVGDFRRGKLRAEPSLGFESLVAAGTSVCRPVNVASLQRSTRSIVEAPALIITSDDCSPYSGCWTVTE